MGGCGRAVRQATGDSLLSSSFVFLLRGVSRAASCAGPYANRIAHLEEDIQALAKKVHDTAQVHEQATGLAPPTRWDLAADKQALQEEPALQVRRRGGNVGRFGRAVG